MKWPWQRSKDHNGAAALAREAEREREEVRRQTPEVRRLAQALHKHLADNQFADRLYQQMLDTRR